MNIAALILRRLTVVYACRTEQGWQYTVMDAVRTRGKAEIRSREPSVSLESWAAGKRKTPLSLVLGGQGIVSKEYPVDDPAARRIMAQPEEFVFASEESEAGQRLTFMRRQSYDEVLGGLSAFKLPVVDVRLDPHDAPEAEAQAAADDFFNRALSARQLLKAGPENNTLFSLLTVKLLLPVLGVVLMALTLNFFAQQGLQRQFDEQQFLLGRLQQNAAVRDKQQDRQQQFQSLLLPEARYPYARLADRLASLIPDGVQLTELSIQPVMKKIQENKALQLELNRISVRGESVAAAPVTHWADTLRTLELLRSVQLLSLTRDRNNRYQFEIDLRL